MIIANQWVRGTGHNKRIAHFLIRVLVAYCHKELTEQNPASYLCQNELFEWNAIQLKRNISWRTCIRYLHAFIDVRMEYEYIFLTEKTLGIVCQLGCCTGYSNPIKKSGIYLRRVSVNYCRNVWSFLLSVRQDYRILRTFGTSMAECNCAESWSAYSNTWRLLERT